MPIKETETDVIFVETLKKETIKDLLHFDKEGNEFFEMFGLKNNLNHIADALTKLISANIKAYLLQYLNEEYDKEKINIGSDKEDGSNKKK